jgi:hypothetical protein
MAVPDEHLSFDHHIAFAERSGLLTGDDKSDLFYYRNAEDMHTLSVTQAVNDLQFSAVQLLPKLLDPDAQLDVRFGLARRLKFIWIALRSLYAGIHPEHTDPINYDTAHAAGRDLNVIYINLRGALDNLARSLIAEFGNQRSKELSPQMVHLFSGEFRKDPGLQEFPDLLKPFVTWNSELKKRRDPAAHRIPLSVPPTVLDETAQARYAELEAEISKAFRIAVEAQKPGNFDKEPFDVVDRLREEQQRLGVFWPVFDHHPDEGFMKIYPTVPDDVGQLVKIGRVVFRRIAEKRP